MSRELLQRALDALKYHTEQTYPFHQTNVAIELLKKELAEPEQEPVAWRNAAMRLGEDLYSVDPNGYYDMTAKQWLDWALSVVNTAPPRKEWVGLTSEDWENTPDTGKQGCERDAELFDWIEQTLKDKNEPSC